MKQIFSSTNMKIRLEPKDKKIHDKISGLECKNSKYFTMTEHSENQVF